MVAARRLVRRDFGADHHPILRTMAWGLTALAWPPAVLLHLWLLRRHRPPEAVPVERVFGAIWAAMRHNILPGEYFAYELWQPDRRAHIDDYLYSNEAARLFKLLNRPMEPDPIGDKLAFHEMCTAHALPTPTVLAAFAPDGPLLDFEAGRPPERDLFVKSRYGMSGLSAERLRWDGSAFVSSRGEPVSPSDASRYLTMQAQHQERALLVQPVYLNHPSLRVETEGALATARLVTGRSANGEIVPIFGFIYFARSNSITSQHGYVALIDVENGRLGSAPPADRSGAKHWHHRFEFGSHGTGILPDWKAALRHATNAHRVCANFVFLGWDIAFTDQGPMLLEGNGNWSADEFQSLSGTPLGLTPFAGILAGNLEKLSE